jgi:hypothetical protein
MTRLVSGKTWSVPSKPPSWNYRDDIREPKKFIPEQQEAPNQCITRSYVPQILSSKIMLSTSNPDFHQEITFEVGKEEADTSTTSPCMDVKLRFFTSLNKTRCSPNQAII